MYRESFFLNFSILSSFSVNGTQALQVNQKCLKCISIMNLPPANKNLLIIRLLFSLNPLSHNIGILHKEISISNLINNPTAS